MYNPVRNSNNSHIANFDYALHARQYAEDFYKPYFIRFLKSPDEISTAIIPFYDFKKIGFKYMP